MTKFTLKNLLLLAGAALCWFQPVVEAAWFLKYEGIDGEAIDTSDHDEWIDVLSIDWGQAKCRRLMDANLLRGSDTPTRRRRLDDCLEEMILKIFEQPSRFEELHLEGKTIPVLSLSLMNVCDDSESFLKYELTNVLVTSYQLTGDCAAPHSEVHLRFEEFEVKEMLLL